jgi:hypothetical protein
MGRTSSLLLALLALPALAGCVTNFRSAAHERITAALACSPSEVKLEEISERVYRAEGCGKRAVYRCFHKRHIKASGARYVVCERVDGPAAP